MLRPAPSHRQRYPTSTASILRANTPVRMSMLTPCVLPSLLLLVSVAVAAVYRLYWSPLAGYPGPKLAALSNWYEFYYDVILQGQFTVQIQSLHKQYGMVVRIPTLSDCP